MIQHIAILPSRREAISSREDALDILSRNWCSIEDVRSNIREAKDRRNKYLM